jgi:hypothetical protein
MRRSNPSATGRDAETHKIGKNFKSKLEMEDRADDGVIHIGRKGFVNFGKVNVDAYRIIIFSAARKTRLQKKPTASLLAHVSR